MSPLADATEAPPAERIQRIEKSLACFVSGLLAIVPVLGLLFAVTGLLQFHASRLGTSSNWNPAARYRRWGAALAVLSLGLHLLAVAAVSVMIAMR